MKDSKKKYIIVIVFFAVIAIAALGLSVYRTVYLRDENLKQILYNEDTVLYGESAESQKINYNVPEKEHMNISNVYLNSLDGVYQLRLEVNYTNPLKHRDLEQNMREQLRFSLKNSEGKDLTSHITVIGDSYFGLPAMQFVAEFEEEEYDSLKGESLTLEFRLLEDEDREFAGARIEMDLPE